MFHRGAEIEGAHPHLVGGGNVVRHVYFETLVDVKAGNEDLRAVIKAWRKQES